MSSTPFVFRLLNPVMKGILKSPLHTVISDKILIFSFKGRITGIDYSTPVSYYQENSTILCFTHAAWWKNFVDDAPVRLWIRGTEFQGVATPIPEDRDKKVIGLGKLLSAVPSDARFYNVTMDDQGKLNQAELNRAADEATMIEVSLGGSID